MAGLGIVALLLCAYMAGKNGNAFMYAAVFAVVNLVLSAIGGQFVLKEALVGGVIIFLFCSVYFWLVERYADNVLLYFVILVGGALLFLGWPFLFV